MHYEGRKEEEDGRRKLFVLHINKVRKLAKTFISCAALCIVSHHKRRIMDTHTERTQIHHRQDDIIKTVFRARKTFNPIAFRLQAIIFPGFRFVTRIFPFSRSQHMLPRWDCLVTRISRLTRKENGT